MPEPGGPAAQSGFYYQNSIAALYLGRLLDPRDSIDARRVVSVRCEAPEKVDDIVVDYADGSREYIQAKEHIGSGKQAAELWKRLREQYEGGTFRAGRDRLVLFTADVGMDALSDAARRSRGAESAAEWQRALNRPQFQRVRAIAGSMAATLAAVHSLFTSLTIEIASVEHLENHRLDDWIPASNRTRDELFRLLRDRVGGHARVRSRMTAAGLRRSLAEESPSLLLRPSPAGRPLEPFEIPHTDLVGRDAEIAQAMDRIGRVPATNASVLWILGDAGSGKTALSAALAGRLDRSERLLAYYSFGTAAARSTSAFAARLQSCLIDPPMSDRPLAALRAGLRKAGLSGGRRVIVLDAIDELLQDEPAFLDDLDRLAARGTVWVLASRPIDAVRARIAAGPPHATLFDSGLPRLSGHSVTKLVREWSGITDPKFIGNIVSAAHGLPLYARCVAEEIRKGVRSPSDTDLPVSLSDFYARAIEQLTSREDGALAAAVAAIAGQALEPVTASDIAAILSMSAGIPMATEEDRRRVERAAGLAVGVIVAGVDGAFAPCHASVRDYFAEAPGSEWRGERDAALPADPAAARRALAATATWWRTMEPGRLRDHMFRFGTRYALQCGGSARARAAERVTSFDYWMERVRDADSLDAIAIAREIESVCTGEEEGEGLEWSQFFRQRAHILSRALPSWPAHKLLLQVAAEAPEGTVARRAADEWLESGACDWVWLRSTDAGASVDRPVPRWTAAAHDGSASDVLVTDDGRLFSWGADGRLCLWDVEDGQQYGETFWGEGEIRSASLTAGNALAFVVATGDCGRAAIWDGHSPIRILQDVDVTALLVTGDGLIAAWGDAGVFTLDGTLSLLGRYDVYASRTVAAMTSDATLAVFTADGESELFAIQPATGAIELLEEHTLDIESDTDELRVAPRRLLVRASRFGHLVFLLDTVTWQIVAKHPGTAAELLGDGTAVISDGNSLALISLETGNVIRRSPPHTELQPQMLVFPFGRVMTWSRRTFRVWNVADLTAPLHESSLPQTNYGIHIVGRNHASETTLEGLRIVSSEAPFIAGTLPAVGDIAYGAAAADRSSIAVWTRNGTLCVWDLSSVTTGAEGSNRCRGAAVLGGNRMVGVMGDRVELIDGENGSVLAASPHSPYPMGCAGVDDSSAVTWSHQELFLWTAGDDRLTCRRIGAAADQFERIAPLPDGSIMTSTERGSQVWLRASGETSISDFPLRSAERERLSWITGEGSSTALFYEPVQGSYLPEDRFIRLPGARVVTAASLGGPVTLYCALSREPLAVADGHDRAIFRLSGDRSFATCDREHVWLWDAATFTREPVPFAHEDVRLVLAPSDQMLLTASGEQTYVWDVTTRTHLTVPLASWDVTACFDVGEGLCVIVPADGPLQCWRVASGGKVWSGSARDLLARHPGWARAIADASLHGVAALALGRIIAIPAREANAGFAIWHGGSDMWIAGVTESYGIAVAQERGRASVLQPYAGGRRLSRNEFLAWCAPARAEPEPVYARIVFVENDGDTAGRLRHKLTLAGYAVRHVKLEGTTFAGYHAQIDAAMVRHAWGEAAERPLILIGAGIGALVAADAALRRCDAVHGLVLVEPYLSAPHVPRRHKRWASEVEAMQRTLFESRAVGIPMLTLASTEDWAARLLHERLSTRSHGELVNIEADDGLLTGLRSREVDDRILTWLAPRTDRAPKAD
jgi:WD40 repeat protein